MVFSGTIFIFFFLPSVLLAYYICPRRMKNGVLLFFSLIFYSWGEPAYIAIMLFSAIFDYVNGSAIEKYMAEGKHRHAKAVLINSVVVNLGILGFFKYSSFLLENVNMIFNADLPHMDIALPIGISFYTFQTMSYTIDVYRGNVAAQKNIINFGVYVTMFPQLVAGPIVQYKDIEAQLNLRTVTVTGFAYGIRRFVVGLSKKVLLANNLGLIWEQISGGNPAILSAGEAWIGAIAFSLQIYFDFSGYSDMAVGLGEMFGFHFRENFNRPYCAKSITEFWRRWHISLGAWFREYVYIPLGGNKKGLKRQIINILIVWSLTGLWHGASWNFILWGAYFGVLLIIEKLFLLKRLERLPALTAHIYALLTVAISWVIFAFADVSEAGLYLKAMFGLNHAAPLNSAAGYYLSSNAWLFAVCIVLSVRIPHPKKLFPKLRICNDIKDNLVNVCRLCLLSALFLLSICFLIGDSYNPFLYFRF